MLEYDRIDIAEGIDVDKTDKSKECMFCHFWYFLNKNFKYGPYLCDGSMIKCKNQQILKILLLLMLEKMYTGFIFHT